MVKEILKESISETKKVLMIPKALGIFTGIFALNGLLATIIDKHIMFVILLILVSFVLSVYIVIYAAGIIQTEEKKLIDEEDVRFKTRLGRLVKASIMAALVLIGISVILYGVIALLSILKLNSLIIFALAIVTFVVTCAYLFRISLIVPISVLSSLEKPFQSSLKMTKGYVWKIILIILVPSIIAIVNTIISLAVAKMGIGQMVNYIITFPLGLITTLLYTIISINIYYYLRNKNDIETLVYEGI